MCLVFIRAKTSDWLEMLVWLRVKAVFLPLIPLVGELMNSKPVFFFFTLKAARGRHRTERLCLHMSSFTNRLNETIN